MADLIVPLAAISLIMAVMILPRYFVRRQGLFGSGAKAKEDLDHQTRMRDKIESLLIELQEVNREVIGRIDTKFRMLAQLHDKVEDGVKTLEGLHVGLDRKMKDLEAFEQRARTLLTEAAPPADPAIAAKFELSNDGPEKGRGRRRRQRRRKLKEAEASIEAPAADMTAEEPVTADAPPPVEEPPAPSPEQREEIRKAAEAIQSQYQRIYELADEGRASVDIAEEFGMQRGEVEFILRLRTQVSKSG